MKIKNAFLLTWKKVLWTIIAWVAAVLLHNLVYGLFKGYFDRHGGDEPFFFFIAIVVIPLYLLISLVYTIVLRSKKKT